MRMLWTEDQLAFGEAVRSLLADHCDPAAVRAAWEGDGRVPGLWGRLAEMGVLGVTAPESAGGLGFDEVALALILEEAGRSACPEPLIEHAAIAVAILAAAGEEELLAQAVAGEICCTVQLGALAPVAGATHAIVAAAGGRLGVLEVPPGLPVAASIEGSRRLASLDPGASRLLDGVTADTALLLGALGAAAAAVGVAGALLDTTVAYVRERHQFGKPVGSNQAVKHHLANVAQAVAFARPCVTRAAWCIAAGVPDSARDVSAAKALASDAVDLAARLALQCHGAIGYTSEYDLGLWLKRAWVLSSSYGDAAYHRARVGAALAL